MILVIKVYHLISCLDLLKRSAPSRIVIVASELYRLSSLNLSNLNPVDGFPAYLYYVSKYANIVFAQELARRLEGTGEQYFHKLWILYFVLTHLKYRQSNIFTYLELVTIQNEQYFTSFIKSSSPQVSLFHKFPAHSRL